MTEKSWMDMGYGYRIWDMDMDYWIIGLLDYWISVLIAFPIQ